MLIQFLTKVYQNLNNGVPQPSFSRHTYHKFSIGLSRGYMPPSL